MGNASSFVLSMAGCGKGGYRTFRVGFNADGASVYRASLAFIFFEKIYKGGQNVLVKSLKTLANTGKIGFYFFIRT